MKRKSQTAFTLIELLVIIALIILLLGALRQANIRPSPNDGTVACLNNQRLIGQAAYVYAADHSDFLPRGIMRTSGEEYNIFVTSLLPYTGYEGDPFVLWDGNGSTAGSGGRPSPTQQKRLRRVLRQVGDVWQCPDFPDYAHDPNRAGDLQFEPNGRPINTSLLDYVASTFPIPYPDEQIIFDVGQDAPPDDDAQWEPSMIPPHYVGMSRLADIEAEMNASEAIYVTESHVQLTWSDFAYHHVFLTSQIPFGVHPRIANDRRHPRGINAMFFDGHARTMRLRRMDRGWPNSIGDRLRWFSVVEP